MIARHGSAVTAEVERLTHRWVAAVGTADGSPIPRDPDDLFRRLDESRRVRVLFGSADDPLGRRVRRTALIRELHVRGLETLPATMGPP